MFVSGEDEYLWVARQTKAFDSRITIKGGVEDPTFEAEDSKKKKKKSEAKAKGQGWSRPRPKAKDSIFLKIMVVKFFVMFREKVFRILHSLKFLMIIQKL